MRGIYCFSRSVRISEFPNLESTFRFFVFSRDCPYFEFGRFPNISELFEDLFHLSEFPSFRIWNQHSEFPNFRINLSIFPNLENIERIWHLEIYGILNLETNLDFEDFVLSTFPNSDFGDRSTLNLEFGDIWNS